MINKTIKILLLRFIIFKYYQFYTLMNRRKFLSYVGCSCCGYLLPSCTTAPITERKQLKLVSESKLNAQAAMIYEKIKENGKFYI